jgi:hypothetical protein
MAAFPQSPRFACAIWHMPAHFGAAGGNTRPRAAVCLQPSGRTGGLFPLPPVAPRRPVSSGRSPGTSTRPLRGPQSPTPDPQSLSDRNRNPRILEIDIPASRWGAPPSHRYDLEPNSGYVINHKSVPPALEERLHELDYLRPRTPRMEQRNLPD